MQLPILIEPDTALGFRAQSFAPLDLVTFGSTRGEAIERMRSAICARLNAGAEIVSIEIGTPYSDAAAPKVASNERRSDDVL